MMLISEYNLSNMRYAEHKAKKKKEKLRGNIVKERKKEERTIYWRK